MTGRPRRPAGSTRGRSGARSTRARGTRRRPSAGATLGTAIGTLLGGAVWALFDRAPWWLIVLIVLAGLLVGLLVHRAGAVRSTEAAEPSDGQGCPQLLDRGVAPGSRTPSTTPVEDTP